MSALAWTVTFGCVLAAYLLGSVSGSLLLAPHISEKGTRVADTANQVVFRVRRDADKREIKLAVEKMFNVEVEKRYGEDALQTLWADPSRMPSASELRDPTSWAARVLLDGWTP